MATSEMPTFVIVSLLWSVSDAVSSNQIEKRKKKYLKTSSVPEVDIQKNKNIINAGSILTEVKNVETQKESESDKTTEKITEKLSDVENSQET